MIRNKYIVLLYYYIFGGCQWGGRGQVEKGYTSGLTVGDVFGGYY